MKLILSAHNLKVSEAIEQHITDKLNKLEHIDHHAIDARVTIEHDHTKIPEKQFSCSMLLAMPGPDLFAEDAENDLYAAIDLVVKKLEQQVRKRHNKFKARKHKDGARDKKDRQETVVES